ncbi:hypothetical protein UPYG_G00219820 [Umbra pygmaea]|uniref:G-protein coupled receptors family 1 profile domain-containing protein n=1 Tax=Umbra pygmaea TaxID=75934 RepID=A0ABD0WLI2_UMBPY
MALSNQSCDNSDELQSYQHRVYAVFYSLILAPGLLGNVLALWVFQVYVRETKRGVLFMKNLAIADLMQVLSSPLRIYYYLNHSWPFGQSVCMFCFYLKYVNMYASIYFLVCVSVRRCELIMHPLRYHSNRRRGDVCVCAAGWLLVCLGCLPFPLLRSASPAPPTPTPYPQFAPHGSTTNPYVTSPSSYSNPGLVCFAELPMQKVTPAAGWALMVSAELIGFILPLVLVLTCACLTVASLHGPGGGRTAVGLRVHDHGEKRRALMMVLSCAGVFLFCFAPYHVTMPLDFLAKAGGLGSCELTEWVLRCHPVTLCLASVNSSLDPLMYYFTTDEFRRRFSRPEVPESFSLTQRLSYTSGTKDLPLTPEP